MNCKKSERRWKKEITLECGQNRESVCGRLAARRIHGHSGSNQARGEKTRKAVRQLGKLKHQLNGIRAAAKALGDSTNRELNTVKKRVMSAAARAKMAKAQRERWAKFRAAKAKGKR
jgi:hypothetical protein